MGESNVYSVTAAAVMVREKLSGEACSQSEFGFLKAVYLVYSFSEVFGLPPLVSSSLDVG